MTKEFEENCCKYGVSAIIVATVQNSGKWHIPDSPRRTAERQLSGGRADILSDKQNWLHMTPFGRTPSVFKSGFADETDICIH